MILARARFSKEYTGLDASYTHPVASAGIIKFVLVVSFWLVACLTATWQTPHVPDRPIMKRGAFIISRVLRAVISFLIIDAAQSFIHTNPLFSGSAAELGNASITSQGLLYRCLNIIAWMSTPHAGVRMQYYLISAISVALGLSTPADWPDPFGKWSDAYTVRNLWGYVADFDNTFPISDLCSLVGHGIR